MNHRANNRGRKKSTLSRELGETREREKITWMHIYFNIANRQYLVLIYGGDLN